MAGHLVAFWNRPAADGGQAHHLATADLDTRFLGDLYQVIEESASRQYALLQTPAFITDAAARALAGGETFYTWQRGIPELRQALAGSRADRL